jgi:3'-phosphoadenosine 5'-phosphosulfate sulfotransferase (PAPS reductase)/FAD synthetase
MIDIKGRVCVLSVSGGKDSAAASLHLMEQGIEHVRVFADTQWEHPDTLAYIRGPLTDKIGPIVEVRSELGFADLVRKKRIFPDRTKRFCTTELKMKPIKRFIDSLVDQYEEDILNVVGIRADESEARSKLSETEWSDFFDCDVWRPLIKWTLEDVIAIHKRHGLMPNPLYLKGALRVGCWPCIHARKEEIRLVAEISPERIDEIRALEKETTDGARDFLAKKGEKLDWERAMFSAHVGKNGHRPMPIDEAVEWASTARGGKQLLLVNDSEPGCVKWGMCESAGKPGTNQWPSDEPLVAEGE